jgi:hypothetical protein
MKYVLNILQWVNRTWANRICTLILIGLLTYSLTRIFEAKTKEDCTAYIEQVKYYSEQNNMLLSAFMEIKKELQPTTTSFVNGSTDIIFAAVRDTVPKKQTQQKQVQQMQQVQQKVLNKIDAILMKIMTDSLKRKDSINNLKNKKS